MKKSFGILFLLMLMLSSFPLASQAAPLQKLSWRAEYYNNPSLSGAPTLSVYEASFGHDWGFGSPSPEIPIDNFSARFTRTMHFEEGTYIFFLSVDDGARIWIDGTLVIDSWSVGNKTNLKTKIQFDKTGDYEIQVAYFERTGKAGIQLEWLKVGSEDDILGAWNGEYFDNRNLAGSPVMTRQDGGINFDWNSGQAHPKVPRDNFSVRWTRSIYLEAGQYTFRVQHDDGMRVYVDGKIIYDSWFDQEVTYEVGLVPLKEGFRTFTVEYYDHVGNAVVYFSIDEDPGDYDDSIPSPDEPGVYVDNNSANFRWVGPGRYVERGGYAGNYFWTTNKYSKRGNYGQWIPSLSSAGNYEVMAYIPGSQATTGNAIYRIQHFGRVAERSVNQGHYNNDYVSLGIYYFDGQGNEFVVLEDVTGEASGSTQLAYDVLKFVKR